jgi:outer membrane protein TolC
LRSAIGWVDPKQSLVVDPNWPVPPDQDPPDLASLVDAARKRRPDILAQDRLVQSGQDLLISSKDEHLPVLSASATVGWQPNTSAINEPSWSAGLTLSWLAFSGGKINADVRVASASLQLAVANRDALLVTITSQIDGARSQIISNRVGVQAANEAVVAARAQLHLADARYAQGLGSQIELADAQTAVTTAEGNLVQSQFQLANAWAQLRRYLGETPT